MNKLPNIYKAKKGPCKKIKNDKQLKKKMQYKSLKIEFVGTYLIQTYCVMYTMYYSNKQCNNNNAYAYKFTAIIITTITLHSMP